MTILEIDTKSINKSVEHVVDSVADSLGTVAETLGSTLGTVTETVTETVTDEVVPAARTGARRTVRIVRSHPRISVLLGGAAIVLLLAMWFRSQRRQTEFEHVRSDESRSRSAA